MRFFTKYENEHLDIISSAIIYFLWNKWDKNCSHQIQPRIIRIRVNEGNWFPLYCKIMYTFLCRVITTHAHKNQRLKVSEKRRKKSKRKAMCVVKSIMHGIELPSERKYLRRYETGIAVNNILIGSSNSIWVFIVQDKRKRKSNCILWINISLKIISFKKSTSLCNSVVGQYSMFTT